MLYENCYDEEGNKSYLLTDEVDPNFYQSACPLEPVGYYPGCSDHDDKFEYYRELNEQMINIDDDLPF